MKTSKRLKLKIFTNNDYASYKEERGTVNSPRGLFQQIDIELKGQFKLVLCLLGSTDLLGTEVRERT